MRASYLTPGIEILIQSSITTLLIGLAGMFIKQKVSYLRYIILFVIILIVNFMFSGRHASQNDHSISPPFIYHYEIPHNQKEMAIQPQPYPKKTNCLTKTKRTFHKKSLSSMNLLLKEPIMQKANATL